MYVNNKAELSALPIVRRPVPADAVFAEQVYFCTFGAYEDNECFFLVSSPQKRELGQPRPQCEAHPDTHTAWCTILVINGKPYRNYSS